MLAEEEKEPFKKHNIKYLPTMLILTPEGREIGRFGDFYPPQVFIEKLNECAAAEDNLKKARELLSKDPESEQGLFLNALGNLYKDGKLADACSDFEKLAQKELTQANKACIFKAVWMLADTARLRFDKKTWVKERNKYLGKLVEIDAKNESGHLIQALYKLGASAMVQKDTVLMKKHFDRIRELDPQDNSGYADDMAYAQAYAPYYSKDYRSAAANLEKFIQKYGKSELAPAACSKLAVCWYRAKEKQKAIEALEKLLRDYPQAKEVDSARKWLKRLKKK